MKISARTCCKLTGLGLGMTLGGPLAGLVGNHLGDLTHSVIGDILGGEHELGTSISGFLANIGAGEFSFTGSPPTDYPDFNHDFRRALLLALIEALQGPVPRRYAQEVGNNTAKQALITRSLKHAVTHLQTISDGAIRKGNSADFDALFPAAVPDHEFFDLQTDGLTAKAQTLLSQWYDQVLGPVIQKESGTDLSYLGGAEEFRKQTLSALAIEFPAAFGKVFKDPKQNRLRAATTRLMMNDVRQIVQQLFPQIAGLDAKLELFIQAHSDDRKLLTVMDGKLDQLQDMADQNLAVGKANLKTGEASHHILQQLKEQFLPDPIEQYKKNLIARFSIHNAVGIPAVEDPKQEKGPDKIEDLFVMPTCSEQRISPEQMQSDIKDGGSNAKALLPELEKSRKVVLLADPGMGKSTLIHWLVSSLAAPIPSRQIAPFGQAIPLPIILREVVRDMPADLELWTWQCLIQTFLTHKHDDHQPPMAAPLAQDEAAWRKLLASQQVWFLLDGLDEIGDPAKRRALRDAIWEGFSTHPEARFLITSRIVGYDDAPIDHYRELFTLLEPEQIAHSLSVENYRRIDQLEKQYPDVEISPLYSGVGIWHPDKAGRGIFIKFGALFYLAPWDDNQQTTFSTYWFKQRLGDSAGQSRARDFVTAVHRNLSTATIGRVPNLLLLMALLFKHRVELPNGRAEVYAAISKAYLQSIAVDHRIEHRTLPYKFEEKERLLAIIAMHMQMRRVQRTQSEDHPTSGHIIASRKDLEEWLSPEFGKSGDLDSIVEMEKFIIHIADISGLLLPRGTQDGQEHYAFAHLSFQEYYTACWLKEQFRRLLNANAQENDEFDLLSTDLKSVTGCAALELEKKDFAAYASNSLWREPLMFLAELLCESQADTQTLRQWLFPIRKDFVLNFSSRSLLSSLSIDPQVNFSLQHRQLLWEHLWSLHLVRGKWISSGISRFLLEPSEFQTRVLSSLRSAVKKKTETKLSLKQCTGFSDLSALKDLPELCDLILSSCIAVRSLSGLQGLCNLRRLSLNGCIALSDLSSIHNLSCLQNLSLNGCIKINNLNGLQSLSNLRELSFRDCGNISDLSALQRLSGLQSLDLTGCTGVSNLSAIQGLTGLKTLYLIGCSRISRQQVKELGSHIPQCQIFH